MAIHDGLPVGRLKMVVVCTKRDGMTQSLRGGLEPPELSRRWLFAILLFLTGAATAAGRGDDSKIVGLVRHLLFDRVLD